MHLRRRHPVPESRSGDRTFRRLEPGAQPGQSKTRCYRARIRSLRSISRPPGTCIPAALEGVVEAFASVAVACPIEMWAIIGLSA